MNPPLPVWTRLSHRDAVLWMTFTLGLTAILAVGFIPTAKGLAAWAVGVSGLSLGPSLSEVVAMLGFPALALFFHLSLPRSSSAVPLVPDRREVRWRCLVASFWIPVLISIIFGAFRGYPPVYSTLGSPVGRLDLFWSLLAIPCGEELLFRGWLYGILSHRWPRTLLTATNPLPIAVWGSALGFAVWHLQNLTVESVALVIFQVLYTFFTGIWLGYLRWRTGRLGLPIAAHFLLNLASNLL